MTGHPRVRRHDHRQPEPAGLAGPGTEHLGVDPDGGGARRLRRTPAPPALDDSRHRKARFGGLCRFSARRRAQSGVRSARERRRPAIRADRFVGMAEREQARLAPRRRRRTRGRPAGRATNPAGTVRCGYPATAAGDEKLAPEVVAVDRVDQPRRAAGRRDQRVEAVRLQHPVEPVVARALPALGERIEVFLRVEPAVAPRPSRTAPGRTTASRGRGARG